MTTLAQEVIEKFERLDEREQREVLAYMQRRNQDAGQEKGEVFAVTEPMSREEGLAALRAFRANIREKYGDRPLSNSADLVNEIREERLNDLMGGR